MDGREDLWIMYLLKDFKQEKIHLILRILNTVKEVKNFLTEYLTFYNNKRIHQSWDYLIPEQAYLTKIIG